MKINSRLWPLLALFLAACAPAMAAIPTETPTVRSMATGTEAPAPTRTRLPTSTLTFTNTPFPSYTPLPIDFPENLSGGWEFSPNGEWVAWGVCCISGPYMLVESVDGSKSWEAWWDFENYGEGGINPLHWSADGRYLYYAISPPIHGPVPRGNYTSLHRMNLETGHITGLIPFEERIFSFSFFAETEKSIKLSIPDSMIRLDFFDFDSGEGWLLRIDEYQGDLMAGDIFWAPDGNRILFRIFDFETDTKPSIIILVNLLERHYEVVGEYEVSDTIPLSWDGSNTADMIVAGEYMGLDITTGELTPATPQP